MKGVNLHHDAGGVRAAVPERMWERRLQILKEGGCNAVRAAHNIPATEFLDLCDRIGLLVMDEVFDEWARGKREYTYHVYFEEWWERDLLAMLHRDRNHPSIVMWSIGNEMPDQSSPSDVAHVKVEIVDKDGRIVPYADNLVKFELTGAQLIGVENGNMMDLSSCKIPERRAFNGLCLAIIQADKAGKIKIKAVSDQLKSAEIEVTAM
jgi:hypothetical protein